MSAYHTGKMQSTVLKDNIFEDDRFLDLKETLKDGLLSLHGSGFSGDACIDGRERK